MTQEGLGELYDALAFDPRHPAPAASAGARVRSRSAGPAPGAGANVIPPEPTPFLQPRDLELIEYALRNDPDAAVAAFRAQGWAKDITKEQLQSLTAMARAAFESPKTYATHVRAALTHGQALTLPPEFTFPGFGKFPIDPGRTKFEEAGDWWGWFWNCAGPTINKPSQAPLRYHTISAKSFIYELEEPAANSPLPVAFFSDYGTGEYQSLYIGNQIETWAPPHVFHLGDVYYAGRKDEYTNHFAGPLENVLKTSRFFHLPENHDEYAGKVPYYKFIDDNRASGTQEQEGSYYCLRNSKFQIIGLDTISQGRRLTDPVIRGWLRERLTEGKAMGTTNILLTGYQGFEYRSPDDVTNLCRDLDPFLEDGDIHLWFWGNVHYAALYKPSLERPVYASCIGHGGFPFGAMTNTHKGDHVLFLEPATRFPRSINVRADRGRNGWCRAQLKPDRGVKLEYVDWMGNVRFTIDFARDQSSLTLKPLSAVESPSW